MARELTDAERDEQFEREKEAAIENLNERTQTPEGQRYSQEEWDEELFALGYAAALDRGKELGRKEFEERIKGLEKALTEELERVADNLARQVASADVNQVRRIVRTGMIQAIAADSSAPENTLRKEVASLRERVKELEGRSHKDFPKV